jgi:hypothetical protein
MRGFFAFLALTLAVLFGGAAALRAQDSDACVLCAGKSSLACPTCGGKGSGRVPCDVCDGAGRTKCALRLDPAVAATSTSKFLHANSQQECPNPSCERGTIPWEDGKTSRCGLCGGTGKVRCLDCVASQSSCAACAGSGKTSGACVDCNGTGKLFCVLCRGEEARCSQCGSDTPPACTVCKGAASAVQACADCGGRARSPCTSCDGVGRVPCRECGCSGRQRMVLVRDGTPGRSAHCPACSGKGSSACPEGADGRMKCALCAGQKRVAQPCRACSAKGTIECRACGKWGFRAAEAQAASLDRPDAGGAAKAGAIELYEFALKRARASFEAAKQVMAARTPPPAPAAGPPPRDMDLKKLTEWMNAFAAELEKHGKAMALWTAAITEQWRMGEAVRRCETALQRLRSAGSPPGK